MVWGLFHGLCREIFFSLHGEIHRSVALRLSGALWAVSPVEALHSSGTSEPGESLAAVVA